MVLREFIRKTFMSLAAKLAAGLILALSATYFAFDPLPIFAQIRDLVIPSSYSSEVDVGERLQAAISELDVKTLGEFETITSQLEVGGFDLAPVTTDTGLNVTGIWQDPDLGLKYELSQIGSAIVLKHRVKERLVATGAGGLVGSMISFHYNTVAGKPGRGRMIVSGESNCLIGACMDEGMNFPDRFCLFRRQCSSDTMPDIEMPEISIDVPVAVIEMRVGQSVIYSIQPPEEQPQEEDAEEPCWSDACDDSIPDWIKASRCDWVNVTIEDVRIDTWQGSERRRYNMYATNARRYWEFLHTRYGNIDLSTIENQMLPEHRIMLQQYRLNNDAAKTLRAEWEESRIS